MASPLGPPPHSENTADLPSAVTREQRPLRISVRITAPSGITTGPSGKPKPLARIFTSLMSRRRFLGLRRLPGFHHRQDFLGEELQPALRHLVGRAAEAEGD